MSRTANLFIDTSTAPPFHFGPGVINFYLRRALEDLGYAVESHLLERVPFPQGRLPLETVELAADQARWPRHALRIYCTRPLDLIAPDGRSPGKDVVFFHGFGYNASAYLQNRHVNLWCANSAYVMRVLASFLLYPIQLAPLNFVPLGPSLIGHVSLVAPCLDYPQGYPTVGADFSASWLKGHGRHCLLGHALRPGKAVPDTSLLLLDAMNSLGGRLTPRLSFKLFVSEADLGRLESAATNIPLRKRLDELIVPLPQLKNAALVRLMRHCAFSLCFDEGAEAFGLYPLESIMVGAPVYTNGTGNLRFLLPSGCGLQVLDHERLYVRNRESRLRAHTAVAEAIVQDIASGSGSKACVKGRRFIENHYDYASFRESLRRLLSGLASPQKAPRLAPNSLRVQLGPLVRLWNPRTGWVISDYLSTQLPPRENTLVKEILSQPGSQIPRRCLRRDRETIFDLFRLGILSLTADLGPFVRLPRRD